MHSQFERVTSIYLTLLQVKSLDKVYPQNDEVFCSTFASRLVDNEALKFNAQFK
jgi:hypothetical protein